MIFSPGNFACVASEAETYREAGYAKNDGMKTSSDCGFRADASGGSPGSVIRQLSGVDRTWRPSAVAWSHFQNWLPSSAGQRPQPTCGD